MHNKTLLILAEGMRPDGFLHCGHPLVETLLKQSSYTMQAQTVMPSVTLPCHMSLFHSVTPQRHNVLTNDYTPPVRPVDGLFEQINRFEGKTAISTTGSSYATYPVRALWISATWQPVMAQRECTKAFR